MTDSLNKDVKHLVQLFKSGSDLSEVDCRIEELINKYSLSELENWRTESRYENSILHEAVLVKKTELLTLLVKKHNFNIDVRRGWDEGTVLHLAFWLKNQEVIDHLFTLGADPSLKNTKGEDYYDFVDRLENALNIIWMDLEFDALPETTFTTHKKPVILECAVVITDRDLNELARNSWTIHQEKEFLDGMSDWHQKAFASKAAGGNNLIEDCLKSKITRQQFEKEVLDFMRMYCPEKTCPLAGSSIHVDKEVLLLDYPNIFNFFHYRIIDVSTIFNLVERWAPDIIADSSRGGPIGDDHRAMSDILKSIASLKVLRQKTFKI